jgi:hypothetical protein
MKEEGRGTAGEGKSGSRETNKVAILRYNFKKHEINWK